MNRVGAVPFLLYHPISHSLKPLSCILHGSIVINTSGRKFTGLLPLVLVSTNNFDLCGQIAILEKFPTRPTLLDLGLTQTNLPFFPLLTPTVIFLKGE